MKLPMDALRWTRPSASGRFGKRRTAYGRRREPGRPGRSPSKARGGSTHSYLRDKAWPPGVHRKRLTLQRLEVRISAYHQFDSGNGTESGSAAPGGILLTGGAMLNAVIRYFDLQSAHRRLVAEGHA